MPRFSKEKITSASDPYSLFLKKEDYEAELEDILADNLAANQDLLDALTLEEQTKLAQSMLLHCPATQLRYFGRALKAITSPITGSINRFYAVIEPLHQVKSCVDGLWDERNKTPHQTLTDSMVLFQQHDEFTYSLLKNQGTRLAERFALLTPAKERSSVARTISTLFPRSTVYEQVNIAFTLKHSIDTLLLGEKPELFFTSKDFVAQHCVSFAPLFTPIREQLPAIAKKLAKIPSSEVRTQVLCAINQLNIPVDGKDNPFAELFKQMGIPKKISVGTSSYSSFNQSLVNPQSSPVKSASEPHNPKTFF